MKKVLLCFSLLLPVASVAATNFTRPGGTAEITEVGAGYIALFTCSAHFIMHRSVDDIMQIELVDLLPFNPPKPEIDEQRQLVRATDLQGRQAVAVFRKSMGCTLLPPNWREADAGNLPYVEFADAPDVSNIPFPNGNKVDLNPNPKQLAVLAKAFNSDAYGAGTVTLSTLVVKDGKLVGERYRPGFGIHQGYRTWSTAKSITASLIGIAVRDGILDIEESANIPQWQYFDDPRQKITLTHLLHMSSGLYSTGADTGAIYFGGQDVVSAITTTPLEAEPNTRWKYANADTLLLLHALRSTLQDDLRYLRYPYDELFHRIGMYDSRMETDHQGNFIGSSQMYTTARDLARFGLLYLNDGVWDGVRILPEGWTEFVVQPAPVHPREDGKQGYGAQFWLLDRLAGVPSGTYTTAGKKGQFVTVIPSHNMVVVRTGVDPNGKRWAQDKFIIDIIEAFD